MKRFLTPTIAIVLLFIATAFTAADSKNLNFTIKKGVFSANGKNITPNWKSSVCTGVLGEDYRVLNKSNYVMTYDDLGVVVFERKYNEKRNGELSEIQFYYQVDETSSVGATSTYKGILKIDKLEVRRELKSSEVFKKLKKWKREKAFGTGNYRLSKDKIYIYFQFNDEETKIMKVSIGEDRRK
jgi:hypothetical protein